MSLYAGFIDQEKALGGTIDKNKYCASAHKTEVYMDTQRDHVVVQD